MWVWVKMEGVLAVVPVLILMDGKMNNIIILQHQKPCAFLQSISEFKLATAFCHKSEILVFKQDNFFP